MFKRVFIFIVSIALLSACGEDEPTRTIHRPSLTKSTPGIKVEIESTGSISYGDTIYMKVTPVKDDVKLLKVKVEVVDTKRVVAESDNGNLKIPTVNSGGGDIRLKIEAEFESGETSHRTKTVKIVALEEAGNWSFDVVERYPHNAHAYTQGLLMHNGYLYEGTGQYGTSKIMKIDLTSGDILKEKSLSSDFFGEGITIFNNKIFQLTYKASRAFVYDLETFKKIDEFTYSFQTGEGWGLTNNDTQLIASDGGDMLYFLNPNDFSIEKRLKVFDENGSIQNINELEYKDGIVYANIYTTARIIAIDSHTGRVTDNYTARGLVLQSETTTDMDVLNGIAFNPLNGNFLITGKNWSKIYEVRAIPAAL